MKLALLVQLFDAVAEDVADLGAVGVGRAGDEGESARLRARRMRLLMTMSDSGPEPRSHSPLVCASSWRLMIWRNPCW